MADKNIIDDLHDGLSRLIEGEVRFDRYSRTLYSTDASPYQIEPLGVVIPKTVEDVQLTVELANRYQLPILPRGAGTSLNGQSIGPAVIIDFSKYLDNVVELDSEAATITVQPGITVADLNAFLQPHGLMLGPDPASANRATIGGCIGNNATGSHSIRYGMMADNVIAVEAILSDASLVQFDALDAEAVATKARRDDLEGRIYRQIPRILEDVKDEILERWPKHWRRASGYNLDRVAAAFLSAEERLALYSDGRYHPTLPSSVHHGRFNLAQLMTGSEGTLGIVTEAKLHLVPRPELTALAVVHFQTLLEACAAIPDILECDPSASELLDRHLIELARRHSAWAKRMGFIEGDPGAVLITEFYGDDKAELHHRLGDLERHLRQRGWDGPIVSITDPHRQQAVWTVRKAGFNLLMSQRSRFKPSPGIEDVSVPPDRLAEYMAGILDICGAKDELPGMVVYAHASAGCLHVRPLLNLHTERGVELMVELTDQACDLALDLGGVLSGEHGDGLTRSAFNPKLFGPTLYRAMKETKRTFDPENKLNPGKVVDALPASKNLRYGSDYRPVELNTAFDWENDGGYIPAVEMCNGAGACRKIGKGTMCPSFMATRDERDTTRGRANTLRAALTGSLPAQEIFSADMYGVMDLCLGCKACKSECPSAVDMARIKAEFLVHHYRHNGLPLFNRMMGLLPTINKWLFRAKPLIPLVNWSLDTRPIKKLLASIGVHEERTLPHYARESFAEWFAHNAGAALPNHEKRPVLLFHDTWTNYNEPHIGQAMVQVLRAAGYEPFLAAGRKCCGRPLITGGQADKARAWADHNIALLGTYARQKIPIVGAEPSCMLTMRDEYIDLATDRDEARAVANATFTFEEFVAREAGEGRFQLGSNSRAHNVLLHGHCHQEALVGNAPSVEALEVAGYKVEIIPSACCGMAGDFGYHSEHYAISKKIAEDRLLPAIRSAADETIIVASGTSCRHQIKELTDRTPIHLAEALAMTLGTKSSA